MHVTGHLVCTCPSVVLYMDWELSLCQANSQAIADWDPSLGSANSRTDNSDRASIH